MSNKEELIIYPSKTKYFALLLLSLVFIFLGILFVIIGFNINIGIDLEIEEGYSRSFFAILGIISVAFFGACGAFLIKRLRVNKPSIIVNQDGFYDNSSAIGIGLIKWDEIEEMRVYSFMNQKLLGIIPKNPDLILARTSKFKRFLSKLNKGLSSATINISKNAINISLEELLEKSMYYFDKYNSNK